jgi:hypothetical protein
MRLLCMLGFHKMYVNWGTWTFKGVNMQCERCNHKEWVDN